MMIQRQLGNKLLDRLSKFSAVGLLGSRQVGKTTLCRDQLTHFDKEHIYLDLERPSDLIKLEDPESFFEIHSKKLIVLDEIQRKPELFPLLRSVIDENRRKGFKNGQFLLLGSASKDLLRQSSESLAGRITYLELTGLTIKEVYSNIHDQEKLWLRGGFPDSFLAGSDTASLEWRNDLITTYLEKDIPLFGLNAPATTLRRLWTMLAHSQGGLLNSSSLAKSLDLSVPTVKKYIDFLSDMLLVRQLHPWYGNVKKRLVKSPKVFVRDSGIVHSLLNIGDLNHLLGHPVNGASWEGWVIENLLAYTPSNANVSFYRTVDGAELDLFIEKGQRRLAIEIKKSSTPKISKGFHLACEDVSANEKYIVYSGQDTYLVKNNVRVIGVLEMIQELVNTYESA